MVAMLLLSLLFCFQSVVNVGAVHISSCYRVEDFIDCSRETEESFQGEVADDVLNIRFNHIQSKHQIEDVKFTKHVIIMLEESLNLCDDINHKLMMVDGKMCTITESTNSFAESSWSIDDELITDTVTFSNSKDEGEITTLEILGYVENTEGNDNEIYVILLGVLSFVCIFIIFVFMILYRKHICFKCYSHNILPSHVDTVSLRRMSSITSLTSDNEIVFSCEMERKCK
ncbi:uncharacterized protein LOC127716459 isoform X1 [Mytilus californianus]|uniref:uncharacterized protein LOC127716459 isoform X1 n=1 Tax=Mytilus californianus TaxID=6549 RepID=UPI002247B609|nr:uncharacterized protein LOC127716459 isoform X1 [Mytilus californianus]